MELEIGRIEEMVTITHILSKRVKVAKEAEMVNVHIKPCDLIEVMDIIMTYLQIFASHNVIQQLQ